MKNKKPLERIYIYPMRDIIEVISDYIGESEYSIFISDIYARTALIKRILLWNMQYKCGKEFGVSVVTIDDYTSALDKIAISMIENSKSYIEHLLYKYCYDIVAASDSRDTLFIDILIIGNNIHIYVL